MKLYKKATIKVLSWLCAVSISASCIGAMPYSAEETTDKAEVTAESTAEIISEGDERDIHWAVTSAKELLITPKYSYYNDCEIPDYTMKGKDCPPWCESRYDINKVIINEGVTRIGDYAFNQMELTEIEFPSNLEEIGIWAFTATNLTSVSIPDTVTSIGGSTFADCTKLKEVKLPSNLGWIDGHLFRNTAITSINIPDSISSIHGSAFKDCKNLTSVTLPTELKMIGSDAFSGSGITSIVIPDFVWKIEYSAFENCNNLSSVTLPASLEEVSDYCFRGCTSLSEITIPGSALNIGQEAFKGCTSLKKAELSKGVQTAEVGIFENCTSLSEVSLPSTLTTIPNAMFKNCTSLTNVKGIGYAQTIGANAYYNCPLSENIMLTNANKIESYSFGNCKALRRVSMSKIASIANLAFVDCEKLEHIIVNTDVKIEGNAFKSCPLLQHINSKKVTLVDEKDGKPYFNPELEELVMNNFTATQDIGFINSYVKYETEYIVNQNITDDMTDMEKAVVLHDWICNKVDYNFDSEALYDNINHVDASIFLNDKTVCSGYAYGYTLLLQAAGIESYVVSGTVTNAGTHAWNIIKLNNHYFQSDVCWDDVNGNDDYFLRCDEEILNDRTGNVYIPSSLYTYTTDDMPNCPYPIGDVSMDCSFDFMDIILLINHLVNISEIENENLVLSDVTYDGTVNVFDVIKCRRSCSEQ